MPTVVEAGQINWRWGRIVGREVVKLASIDLQMDRLDTGSDDFQLKRYLNLTAQRAKIRKRLDEDMAKWVDEIKWAIRHKLPV